MRFHPEAQGPKAGSREGRESAWMDGRGVTTLMVNGQGERANLQNEMESADSRRKTSEKRNITRRRKVLSGGEFMACQRPVMNGAGTRRGPKPVGCPERRPGRREKIVEN